MFLKPKKVGFYFFNNKYVSYFLFLKIKIILKNNFFFKNKILFFKNSSKQPLRALSFDC